MDQQTTTAAEAAPDASPLRGWGEAGFYCSPGMAQRLDRLYYLVMYRRLVTVVSGPEGAGKTRLLQALGERVRGNGRAALVPATAAMDAAKLMQACIGALGVDKAESGGPAGAGVEPLLDQLRALLDRPRPRPRFVLLMVDDAQALDAGVLAFLLSLPGRLQGTLKPLRLVLGGRPELAERLVRVGRGGPVLHIEQLAPLTREQVRDYLRHCLRTTGVRGNGPFDTEEVDRLCEQSAGWPGRVDALARQALEGYSPRNRGLSGWPWLGWSLGSVLLAGLLAGLWAYQQGWITSAMRPYGTAPSGPAGPPAASADIAAVPPGAGEKQGLAQAAPPISAAGGEGGGAGVGEGRLPEPASAGQSPPAVQADRGGQDGAAEADDGKAAGTEAQGEGQGAEGSAAEEGPGTTRADAAKTQQPTATAVADAAPAADTVALHGDDWILAQAPAQWTLQLTAANEQEPLERFFQAHRDAGPWAYYYLRSKGKDWYSLIYGLYPSQSEAEAAVDDLPFLVEEPWVRRMEAIQASIRRAGRRR